MAPLDDFVFTLSDNDDLPVSDVESSESEKQPSKKRKRTDTNGTKRKKTKLDEADAEDSGEENAIKDDALDSDFEFDVDVPTIDDGLVEFDGWGEDHGKLNGTKKSVDLDGIIARRAQKAPQPDVELEEEIEGDIENQGSEGSGYEDEEEDEQEDVEFPNFEDDELVADDAFGAGAEPEEDVEQNAGRSDKDGSDGEDSDDESIASPVAHPDDLASAHSDDDSVTSQDDAEELAKRKAFFAPEDAHKSTPTADLAKSFQQFSLSRPILRAVAALNFSEPTPIQTRTIPIALQGLDVVGSAVTGSGKTAAFLLPILERLLFRQKKVPTTRVVILLPTRELAVQCYNVATALTKFTDITVAQVVGGFSLRDQEAILKKRPDIVIATPGRFIDHMRNSASFTTDSIEILVLDEADRMLETGFADELDEILRTLPKSRQTMLFSATMTDTVDKLVRVGMSRPVRVSVDPKRSTTSGLTQEFIRLRPGREHLRLATLCVLCLDHFTDRTIIFFRQKHVAHRVRILFALLGIKSAELHGSMSQSERLAAVTSFRDGKSTHLLATDLASRGLDIKNVATVVNYEAPQTHEIYLHRVGRTARAGKSGRACTIAAETDRKVVKAAVKSGRAQGAKIASRTIDAPQLDAMHDRITSLETEITEILSEEKAERALTQAQTELSRGENLVKHHDEIKARPKRTWFESEREKENLKKRAKVEAEEADKGKTELQREKERLLKQVKTTGLGGGGKGKMSGKERKRADSTRERKETGMGEKKGKKIMERGGGGGAGRGRGGSRGGGRGGGRGGSVKVGRSARGGGKGKSKR